MEERVQGREYDSGLETEEPWVEEWSEEVRNDSGSGTVAAEECEPSLSNSDEVPGAATKRRRLSQITAMGDDPL